MNDSSLRLSVIVFLAVCLVAAPLRAADFRDPSLPPEVRAAALVSQLTLAEKISMMASGQPAIPRLGIAAHNIGGEALHGIAYQNATVFPQATGLAHTWDTDLIRAVASAIADEARIFYRQDPTHRGLSYWSPVVDLARDPRWGRSEEVYGEDPYLSAAIGGAFVHGMQDDDPRYLKTAPTLKHFAANSMEDGRGSSSSNVDPRNLREYYLKPFEKITREERVRSYMVAYNAINFLPCVVTNYIRDLARAEWGFNGFVVTDAGDLGGLVSGHHYAPDNATAAALIIKAGMDSITDSAAVSSVQAAIDRGLLTESDLDTTLRRNLRIRFLVGEFDPPGSTPYDSIPDSDLLSPEHAALARRAGQESVVLLKNEGNLLPLDASRMRNVAVIGPSAGLVYRDWYAGYLTYAITPLQGIRDRIGAADRVHFDDGASQIIIQSRVNNRWVTAGSSGSSALLASASIPTQSETFLAQDFGWGCTVLRSIVNGQYVKAGTNSILAATDAAAYGWNYDYCFNFVQQPGGGFAIQYYNGRYVTAGSGGNSSLRATATSVGSSEKFNLLTVSDGVQRAAALAAGADAAIVVVGNNTTINGKENADRQDITLPPEQEQLIQAVRAINPNTIVVLVASYPLAVNWTDQNVPAILYTSHGGQELGRFLADVLFGDYNPAGRLTQTWFRSSADLPPIADYDIRKGRTYWYFQGTPLYPFGYGLSYSTFDYSNLSVSPAQAGPGDTLQVGVDIRNSGARAGDEVVQLYTKALASKVQRPLQELKRFARVSLQPGETRTVTFSLPVSELNFWDVRRGRFTVEKGTVELRVGASSGDIRLAAQVRVDGDTLPPRNGQGVLRAENYDEYSSVLLAQSGDGAQVARYQADGAWLGFREVDFGAGISQMTVRAAVPGQAGSIEAHLDSLTGPLAGACAVASTGSATVLAMVNCANFQASGVHDLYLVARTASGAQINLDWFQFGASAAALPVIDNSGVVDAASYTSPLLRGSWGAIFGRNLASATRFWAAADFQGGTMPTALDGTRVLVNGVPAPVYYVSPTLVEFQAPVAIGVGAGVAQVVTAAGASAPMPVTIDEIRPSFFAENVAGRNWALAQHADYSRIGPVPGTSARPGEIIVLWGSGFGQTYPPMAPGAVLGVPAGLADAAGVAVTIGGQPALVNYAGMSMAGLYQINVTVPDLPDGDYPVAAVASGRSTAASVLAPVRR
jgi:beta-glucosidase